MDESCVLGTHYRDIWNFTKEVIGSMRNGIQLVKKYYYFSVSTISYSFVFFAPCNYSESYFCRIFGMFDNQRRKIYI